MGDVFLDSYIKGSIKRLSPEYPVPVIDYIENEYSLGGAGNLCSNINNLGAKIYLFSQKSKDYHAKTVLKLLKQIKVDDSLLLSNEKYNTVVKTRVTVQGHHFLRLDKEKNEDFSSNDINALIDWSLVEKIILKVDKVVISDYGKGMCNEINLKKIINLSKKHHKPILIDPRKKNKNYKIYKGCDLITPNLNELRLVKENIKNTDSDVLKACKILQKKYGINNILATRSEEGLTYVSKNKILHDKVIKSNVFDVSGAGDTILSIITLLLNSKIEEKKILKIANLCAKYVISYRGTKAIDKEGLSGILNDV